MTIGAAVQMGIWNLRSEIIRYHSAGKLR